MSLVIIIYWDRFKRIRLFSTVHCWLST